ncbi:DUF4123 domain-containing protein [Epibacterium sp. SM1979]|uniref:DUF4123 domain-containing protein n=1 Tax=Tritonibacter litoralis TaxID=2662264 RepID=A0A843YMG8_9RHOB|nr:DUF4123 domain-containing protein [Tritonibacter litoralis]MQQ10614.1 DUF4123 domain-containing protein [Tritonibacter litoralis]
MSAQPASPELDYESVTALTDALFDARPQGHKIYLVLDASRSKEISSLVQTLDDEAMCLFDGQAYVDLAEVAPWIVPIHSKTNAVLDWFLNEAWGQDIGYFLFSNGVARKVKTSLKRSFRIQDENARNLFFKIYRPSVFRTYLPLMERDQVVFVLRDFPQVWTEEPQDPWVVNTFSHSDGLLEHKRLNISADSHDTHEEIGE